MIPQMRRAPDHEWLKMIVILLMFALVIVGSVFEITVWWSTTGS